MCCRRDSCRFLMHESQSSQQQQQKQPPLRLRLTHHHQNQASPEEHDNDDFSDISSNSTTTMDAANGCQSMEWLFKKERMYLLAQFWQQVRVNNIRTLMSSLLYHRGERIAPHRLDYKGWAANNHPQVVR